jgi:hypothetical protein
MMPGGTGPVYPPGSLETGMRARVSQALSVSIRQWRPGGSAPPQLRRLAGCRRRPPGDDGRSSYAPRIVKQYRSETRTAENCQTGVVGVDAEALAIVDPEAAYPVVLAREALALRELDVGAVPSRTRMGESDPPIYRTRRETARTLHPNSDSNRSES